MLNQSSRNLRKSNITYKEIENKNFNLIQTLHKDIHFKNYL